jgi:3',5'-nucleoside bisphosphate phosphatase
MIDLHMHTLNSDGDKTTIEILKMCEEKKLNYISITDHDNCHSYNDLNNIDVKKYYSGKIIYGAEMTTSFENNVIEILGYGVDMEVINEFHKTNYTVEKLIERENYLFNKLLSICKDLELKNTENLELYIIKRGFAKRIIYDDLLKYKENFNIIDNELLQNFSNFARKGLANPKNKLYLGEDKLFPDLNEVAKLIKAGNGLCFLAHLYQYGIGDDIEFLNRLRKEIKLDGLECYYSYFTDEQTSTILEYAKENKLYISGGSDYHGVLKPGIDIGVGKGNLNIKEEIINPWIDKVKKYC